MISVPQKTALADGKCSGLYWISGLTAVVYLAASIFYIGGPESRSRTAKEIFAWVLVLTLLPLFWKGYQVVKASSDDEALRLCVFFAGLFCLFAFLTVPFHSTDVFGYINRGWQQVHYGQNPYVYRLADVPGWADDPMLREHWLYNPNPYGFLFSLLARFLCWIGNGNWWVTLALFKAVNIAAYAATGWLVWSGAKLLGHKRPINALYLFLWNPLILVHHIANGHNDILVGFTIVLSLYLAIRGAYVWIIPVLVGATLLKYGPVLLIPLAAIFIYRKKGVKPVLLGCLLGAMIAAAVSFPYLKDWQMISLEDIRDNAVLIDNSLHSFLIHIFENISKLIPALADFHDTVNRALSMSLKAGVGLFFLVIVYRTLKNVSLELLIQRSVLLMFVLICVASSKFNAWYMGMLLAPALYLAERHWLRRLIVLITGAEVLSITFFKQAYILNYFAMLLLPEWWIFRQVRKEKREVVTEAEPR